MFLDCRRAFRFSYPPAKKHIHNQDNFRGVLGLKTYIEERAVEVAKFMIHTNATVRETAKKFGISKSTVHMEVNIKNGLCAWCGEVEEGRAGKPCPAFLIITYFY